VVKYIVKKILYGFLVLFGVVTAIFFLFSAKPGDPALMAGGNHATAEVIQNIRKDLGLDLPIVERYALYLNDLSPVSIQNKHDKNSHLYLDTAKYDASELMSFSENRVLVYKTPYLRRSYETKRAVSDVVFEKLPNTLVLAFAAMFFATLIGIVMGIISAVNKGSFYDNSSFIIAVTGMSAPSFFMATIISTVGGLKWAEQMDLPAFPLMTMLLGLIIGIITYFRENNKLSKTLKFSFRNFLGYGIKGFFIGGGVWAIYIIGFSIFNYSDVPLIGTTFPFPGTGLDPVGSLIGIDDFTGEDRYYFGNLILPALTLDVLSQDYIRTAKAKGLSFYTIIFKHALKNALNPVITAVSGWFASLLAGAVFVERIFGWDGIGNELINALQKDDLPIVMGAVIVISAFFVVINILVDISYGFLDPRVRMS
jgi:ABC-type dipeptide/oligopeptide/nickel transport system permease component